MTFVTKKWCFFFKAFLRYVAGNICLSSHSAVSDMALRKLTSLVDAAGEALGITEDPLLTIIGMEHLWDHNNKQ